MTLRILSAGLIAGALLAAPAWAQQSGSGSALTRPSLQQQIGDSLDRWRLARTSMTQSNAQRQRYQEQETQALGTAMQSAAVLNASLIGLSTRPLSEAQLAKIQQQRQEWNAAINTHSNSTNARNATANAHNQACDNFQRFSTELINQLLAATGRPPV